MNADRYKYLFLIVLLIATAIPSLFDLAHGSYRWQMILVYISSSLLLGFLVRSSRSNTHLHPLTPHLIRLGILSLVLCAIFSYLYPLFAFPVPTGRYAVGTTSLSLRDPSRIEQCEPTRAFNRELIVRVWYPANETNGMRAAYLEDKRLVPPGTFSHLGLIKTNAVRDQSFVSTDKPYPVILYSPSWSGMKTDNTFQTEELASHGYVVFGLEHPCAAAMSVYPDGRIVYGKWSADYTSSDAALARLLREGEEHLVLRIQDIEFVLNRLYQLNRLGKFKGMLDLNKIGIFGHSFGGAAAAQACAVDARLKAGMNMDGLLFGSVAYSGAPQPFMFMRSDYPRPSASDLYSPNGKFRRAKQTDAWGFEQQERWFQRYGGYDLKLLRSTHMNFSDYPLRARHNNGGGQISVDRAMKIINSYTVAFFDRHLQGKASQLLDRKSGSPFPEVVFENYSNTQS